MNTHIINYFQTHIKRCRLKKVNSLKVYITLLIGLISFSAKARIYVDASNFSGTYTGTSWTSAFQNLDLAISSAGAGDSIWVAKGTYTPLSGTSFVMKDSVKIFGGFLTGAVSFVSRNWDVNVCILLGNGNRVVCNKFTASNPLSNNALLDGFTITGGASDSGAGIFNIYANPLFNNLKINSNIANLYGGGVYNFMSFPVLNNVIIQANTAGTDGGGMNNTGSGPLLENVRITENTAYGKGGGVYNITSAVLFYHSVLDSNAADYGGGVYNDSLSDIVLEEVFFSSNLAISQGGGMFNRMSVVDFINGSVENNTAYSGGGGMCNYFCDSVKLIEVAVKDNCVMGWYPGGGIYNHNSKIVMDSVLISGNYIPHGNGGGIFNDSSDLTFNNGTITNNAGGKGGGLYNWSSSLCFANANISNNRANDDTGGGMANMFSELVFFNVDIDSNQAPGNGAGILNAYSSIIFENGRLTYNLTGENGGGISNINSVQTIKNANFSDNYAESFGGGIYNAEATVWVDSCVFKSNYAEWGGGGMYNTSSFLTEITNSTFFENTTNRNGGGIDNADNSSPVISNTRFIGNQALVMGGGMHNVNLSSPAVTNAYFYLNKSGKGGAVNNEQSSPLFTNAVFEENENIDLTDSNSCGGAIYNTNTSNPVFTNSTFYLNRGHKGGAIYNDGTDTPVISNTVFWNNATMDTAGNKDIFNLAQTSFNYCYISQTGGTGNVLNKNNPFYNINNTIGGDNVFMTADDGLYLAQGSAAVDAGDNAYVTSGVNKDITGSVRIQSVVDMGAYEGAMMALPLKSINFSGILHHAIAQLQWFNEEDINLAQFEIEASLDGSTYQKIGNIRSHGFAGDYYFNAAQAATETYYRLKLVYTDNKSLLSDPILLSQPALKILILSPNPANESIRINSDKAVTLYIYNIIGNLLMTKELDKGSNFIEIKTLPKGVYWCKAQDKIIKFIKE